MNYDKLLKIIDETKTISPMKVKKLAKLVQKHLEETDTTKSALLERRIRDAVYMVFIDLLDADSRTKIYDLGQEIAYSCMEIESAGWNISYIGAYRYVIKEDSAIVVDKVPREYKKPFHLDEYSTPNAVDFYNKHKDQLSIISKKMDIRQEAITSGKKPKNSSISPELLDEFVDVLDLPKIDMVFDRENKKEI